MPTLMRAIAEEERLMPHFHLSAQSGDDMILKRMKRRHTRADTIAFCDDGAPPAPRCRLRRRPDRGLSHRKRSDVREQPEAGGRCRAFAACMSFPFSPRPGTPAAQHAATARAPWSRNAPPGCAPRAKRRWRRGCDAMSRQPRRPCWWNAAASAARPVSRRSQFDGVPRRARFVPSRITGRNGDHLIAALRHENIRRSAAAAHLLRAAEGRPGQDGGLGDSLIGCSPRRSWMPTTLAELEEALIRADLGAAQAKTHRRRRRPRAAMTPKSPSAELRGVLAGEIAAPAGPDRRSRWRSTTAKSPSSSWWPGVNGTGKTTTIGKLAKRLAEDGAQGDAGGGRHLPRRRHRAAAASGPTRARRRIRRHQAGRRCRGPGLRGAGESARQWQRRPADRHGRPAAEQGRPDGRAGKNRPRDQEAGCLRAPCRAAGAGRHHRPERHLARSRPSRPPCR